MGDGHNLSQSNAVALLGTLNPSYRFPPHVEFGGYEPLFVNSGKRLAFHEKFFSYLSLYRCALFIQVACWAGGVCSFGANRELFMQRLQEFYRRLVASKGYRLTGYNTGGTVALD